MNNSQDIFEKYKNCETDDSTPLWIEECEKFDPSALENIPPHKIRNEVLPNGKVLANSWIVEPVEEE